MKKNFQISTKTALINLYLYIKNYSSNKKNKKTEEDVEHLKSFTEINIIKYIKDSIDAMILIMAEKKINDYNSKYANENIQQDYESMLVKYEKDIRGHIKTEHQLKLFADSLQNNIDDLERDKNDMTSNNYKEIIMGKNNIINELKKENAYNKKLVKSYEEQNIQLANNEKKLKNLILKIEKKHKNEIEILNKKIKYYIDKLDNLYIERDEINKKNETIYCISSRHPLNQNLMNNYLENDNSNHNDNRIYRNASNSISVSNNHSTSLVNSRPYEKFEKFLLNKYQKNSNKNKYQNKTKIIKNSSANRSKDKSLRNSHNNISNNSYIIDSKLHDELINKLMINDSSLNNTIKKNKKVYHRHKSIENEKFIKGKQMNIIKKILMSNNNNNANNSLKNSCKDINKGYYNHNNSNNEMLSKKITSSNNNSSMNNSKNYINKATKDMNISNIIGNKNNIGCNFVNNINIYSNNIKRDNNTNMYLKKYSGHSSVREFINDESLHNSNYINQDQENENKNNYINYRNRIKEGKMVSSLSNTLHKKYN
jgi:hypothetical protein